MKTSKVVFIVFFGIIALLCLSVLIPAKESEGNNNKNELKKSTAAAPHFKYLVVEKGCNVRLRTETSDEWKFMVDDNVDSVKFEPGYYLKGDTMVVTSTGYITKKQITLWCKAPKSMHVKGFLRVDNVQDSLNISAVKGTVVIDEKQTASYVHFVGVNTKLICYSNSVKRIELELQHSVAKMSSRDVAFFEAKLKDGCDVDVRSALSIKVERDSSSKVRVYN